MDILSRSYMLVTSGNLRVENQEFLVIDVIVVVVVVERRWSWRI